MLEYYCYFIKVTSIELFSFLNIFVSLYSPDPVDLFLLVKGAWIIFEVAEKNSTFEGLISRIRRMVFWTFQGMSCFFRSPHGFQPKI